MGVRQYRAMVRKDLLTELRTRETVVAMFLFVVLAMVVFHYAFTVAGGGPLSFYTGGMVWVVFVFGALLGLNRSFAHEKDENVLDGLLLCPVDRVTIFLAKMTGNLIFLGIIQVVALPVFALFFAPQASVARLPALLGLILLADLGIATLGTLLATIAMQTRARDLLLPIVFLPLAIPLVIVAASATSTLLSAGGDVSAVLGRLAFVLVYDGIFLVLAYGTYDVAIGE